MRTLYCSEPWGPFLACLDPRAGPVAALGRWVTEAAPRRGGGLGGHECARLDPAYTQEPQDGPKGGGGSTLPGAGCRWGYRLGGSQVSVGGSYHIWKASPSSFPYS